MSHAFHTLVRTHQGAIRAFLRRLTRDAALADDLAQQTFIKAFHKWDKLQDPSKAKSWLFQIAYRTFLDTHRKNKRRQTLFEAQAEPPPTSTQPGMATDIAKAMDNLSDECRAVVMLVLANGLTHDEAARATGLPLGTVKSHITRGKSKLQTFLAAYKVSQ